MSSHVTYLHAYARRRRITRALDAIELAMAELERRGDIRGLEELRDDLSAGLRLVEGAPVPVEPMRGARVIPIERYAE